MSASPFHWIDLVRPLEPAEARFAAERTRGTSAIAGWQHRKIKWIARTTQIVIVPEPVEPHLSTRSVMQRSGSQRRMW